MEIAKANILYFAPCGLAGGLGGSTRLKNMLDVLGKLEANTQLISYFPEKKFKVTRKQINNHLNMTTICVPSSSPKILKISALVPIFIHGLKRIKKSDIIIAFTPSIVSGFPALILAKIFGKPLLVDHTDIKDPYTPKFLYNSVLKNSSTVFTISQCLEEQVREIGCRNVVYVPAFIDAEAFQKDVLERVKIRGKLGIDDKEIVVGYAGSFSRLEGLSFLFKAFSSLSKRYGNIKLVLLGGRNVPGSDNIPRLINELNLKERVIIIPPQPYELMPKYLSVFDIACSPIIDSAVFRATCPIKICEYMSMGLPTIVSAVGEISNIIENGCDGFLVKPGDEDDLERILEYVIQNLDSLQEVRKKAREKVIKNYTQEVIMKRIGHALKELGSKTNMKKRHQDIGIVAFPICEADNVPLPSDAGAGFASFSNLVDILHHFSDNLYVLTGNKERILFKKNVEMHVFEVWHKGGANLFTRVINYIFTQLKLSFKLAKLSKRVNLWIFFIGAEGLVLPMVTAKLLRRQVVLALTGFPARVSKEGKDLLLKKMDLLQKINLALSDRIIAYSERIVAEQNLEKHRSKISIAREHFLDFSKFKIQRPLSQRNNLIAYIGRLRKEKGILNFMEALPRILDKRSGISFLIGGDGQLRGRIKEYLTRENLNSKVEFPRWIPHDELPQYLNKVKLLVLPSYTEGLPNIMLEAMACGTPVLATAVGAIPDVIKDGETGFIMEDNSPACIAINVIRALEHSNLEQITRNARALVEKEYTLEAAVKVYEDVLTSLK